MAAVSFYIPANSEQGFPFLHIPSALVIFCFVFMLTVAVLVRVNLIESFGFLLYAPVIPNNFLKEDLGAMRGKFPSTTRKGYFQRNRKQHQKPPDAEIRILRDEEEKAMVALEKCSIISSAAFTSSVRLNMGV